MQRHNRSVFRRPSGLSARALVIEPVSDHLDRIGILALLAVGLLSAASMGAQAAPPGYLLDPADPDRPVPPLVYRDVTAGTKILRPVDPKSWAAQNRAVTPKPGEDGMAGMPGMDHGGMKGMPGMDHGGMKGMGGK